MYHPTRGGVRGGRDQFDWDSVKSDKYRESYLGHSVKATIGRWQKGRDLTWYAKDKVSGKKLSEEEKKMVDEIKLQEHEMLLEQIGAKPRKPRRTEEEIDKMKMEEVLARGQLERDEKLDTDRVAGLGFAPTWKHPEGTGSNAEKVQKLSDKLDSSLDDPNLNGLSRAEDGDLDAVELRAEVRNDKSSLSKEERKKLRKLEKRERKEEKKRLKLELKQLRRQEKARQESVQDQARERTDRVRSRSRGDDRDLDRNRDQRFDEDRGRVLDRNRDQRFDEDRGRVLNRNRDQRFDEDRGRDRHHGSERVHRHDRQRYRSPSQERPRRRRRHDSRSRSPDRRARRR